MENREKALHIRLQFRQMTHNSSKPEAGGLGEGRRSTEETGRGLVRGAA